MNEKHKKYVVEARYFDGLILNIGWTLIRLRELNPDDPRLDDIYNYMTLILQSKYTLAEEHKNVTDNS